MHYINKLVNSQYFVGTLYYSFPGLFSILISLVSIPIFLNYLEISAYSNYMINHFILTVAIITNLNFGRIATINISRKKKDKDNIFFTSIIFTSIFSTILTLLIFFLIVIVVKSYNLENIKTILNLKILIGLILTNFYLTLEGVFKGNLNYRLLSIFNLIFYSISISLPSLFVLNEIYSDIFFVSILIKFTVVFLMFIINIRKIKFHNLKIHTPYLNDCINNLKWMTLNTVLNQIYNYFDKYLIKIFLDNLAFVYYTVSQQITSKLGDPLLSYNNIFIAKTNLKKNNMRDSLSFSTIFYCTYIFAIFLVLYIFLNKALKLWLGDAFDPNYAELIKIFFLIATVGSFSKLIIDYFDLSGNSKKNSTIEIITLIPFILGIILSIISKNILYFALLILLKEILTLSIRIYFIRRFFYFKKFIITQFSLTIVNTIIWFYNFDIHLLVILQFFHLVLLIPFKKLRIFYRI